MGPEVCRALAAAPVPRPPLQNCDPAWVAGQAGLSDEIIALINRDAALAGTVPLGRLLLADTEQRMSELTSEPLLSIAADTKDKEVFELFDKYNLRSLTVINEHNHPIGSITVDDVVSKMRAKL